MSLTTPLFLALLMNTAAAPAVDFDTDIMPILTKAGCNVGACHGAAIGRGGFKLSLYGGDSTADYDAIVHQLEGRRVNFASPEDSLFILKPTNSIGHGGGARLEIDDEAVQRIVSWLNQGAPQTSQRKLVKIEVEPRRVVATQPGDEFPLRAIARYDDGSTRDITRWTVFTPDDPAAISIDAESAKAKVLEQGRGRSVIIARYIDRVVAIQVLVPLSDQRISLEKESRDNLVDEHVLNLLDTLRLPVSPPCDDTIFLRRVRLDLTGRLPTPKEVLAFASDKRADKRARLVDRLLASDDFTSYWTFQFAKLLRIRSQPQDVEGALTYHRWLRDQIGKGRSYALMARDMLTALGDTHASGPPNFYRTVSGPRMQAEFVSELFLGVRLRCANCHNHPLDQWTQNDYHGFARLFARIDQGKVIKLKSRGDVTNPRTGEPAIPRIPGDRDLPVDIRDGRTAFADWLTSANNPFFARAVVNRLWKHLMGRGLVEPTDDLRATNPATHPKLLRSLSDDFVQHEYNIRHTLRMIATSSTYARSSKPLPANAADNQFYSHALTKPLTAEVLADAISDVTGVWDQYGSEKVGTRAIELFDGRIASDALDILGRCSREESCETPVASNGGLAKKLHLINGGLLNRKVVSKEGRLQRLLKQETSAVQIVEEFYLRGLSRPIRDNERAYWMRQLESTKNSAERAAILEDFVWSLLSSRSFVENY